jgi:hypothetical protein
VDARHNAGHDEAGFNLKQIRASDPGINARNLNDRLSPIVTTTATAGRHLSPIKETPR